MWASMACLRQFVKEALNRMMDGHLVGPDVVAQQNMRAVGDGHMSTRRVVLNAGHQGQGGVYGPDR